jgi:hypothetical protein
MPRLRVSAFSVFLKDCASIEGLPGGSRRGRAVASLYRALSHEERESLRVRASREPAYARKPRKAKKTTSNAYAQFVKAQHRNAPGETFSQKSQAVAAMWRRLGREE